MDVDIKGFEPDSREDSEALSPHIVIAASQTEAFAPFAETLEQNGFSCSVVKESELNVELAKRRSGTIFFVSWNLGNVDAERVAKELPSVNQSSVVVFAELDDAKTRAELSAKPLENKIQHPYKERNFLMAVQKIQNDRKKVYEAKLRKYKHHQRIKAAQEPPKKEELQVNMRESHQSESQRDGAPIIQKGAQSKSQDTHIRGEKPKEASSVVQKGQVTKTHVAVQKGASSNSHMAIQKGVSQTPEHHLIRGDREKGRTTSVRKVAPDPQRSERISEPKDRVEAEVSPKKQSPPQKKQQAPKLEEEIPPQKGKETQPQAQAQRGQFTRMELILMALGIFIGGLISLALLLYVFVGERFLAQ